MREQLIKTTDVQQLINHCKHNLDLANAKLGEEYYYANLPLCLIDTIFSLGTLYSVTQSVVSRFCNYFQLQRLRDDSKQFPEFTVADFISLHTTYPPQFMADEVYKNHRPTSASQDAILRAEAVLRVAQVLSSFQVNVLTDMPNVKDSAKFEAAFKRIPGQTSGISLRYFYMLTGSDDEIKPDRMIRRFIEAAVTREPKIEECRPLLVATCEILNADYSDLTLRSLDYLIWNFQRSQ